METICLHCGNKGWENAFVYCVECLDCAVHRYCLPVIPETFDEFVPWHCEDCEVERKKNDVVVARVDGPREPYEDGPREPYDARLELELVKSDRSTNELSHMQLERTNKKRAIISAEDERKRCKMSSNLGVFLKDILKRNKKRNKRKRKRDRLLCNETLESPKKKLVVCGLMVKKQMHITCSKQPRDGNKGSGLEKPSFDPSSDCMENGELVNRDEIASTLNQIIDLSKDFTENIDIIQSAEPVVMPIWRGNFNIVNKKHDISGLVAHLSSKACQRVYEAACQFENVLHFEMLPKSNVWPKSFEKQEPSGENIALYFFSSDISERDFGHLIDEMMHKELALKAVLQHAELLIFTSTELPLLYWRFQEKYYLWGVFRGKQNPPSKSLSRVDSGVKSITQSVDNISLAVKTNGARRPL